MYPLEKIWAPAYPFWRDSTDCLEQASFNKPYFTVNKGRGTGIRYLGLKPAVYLKTGAG